MSHPVPPRLSIIAPPPLLYIGAFMFGLAVHTVLPVWLFPATPLFKILGSLLVVLSGAFARWAFWTMRGLGTTASPRKQSEVLATSGPFRLSRNPIYVAMTGLYLGLVLLANALWPLVLLAPLLLLMHWGVIRREEYYLSEKFGEAYLAYRSQVRRWL